MTIVPLKELKKNSTNVARFRKLHDDEEGTYLDDATVTCTLFDADGNPVVGAVALPMAFVAGATPAKGEYRATLAHTLPLVVGQLYDLVYFIVAADGSRLEHHEACRCVVG